MAASAGTRSPAAPAASQPVWDAGSSADGRRWLRTYGTVVSAVSPNPMAPTTARAPVVRFADQDGVVHEWTRSWGVSIGGPYPGDTVVVTFNADNPMDASISQGWGSPERADVAVGVKVMLGIVGVTVVLPMLVLVIRAAVGLH